MDYTAPSEEMCAFLSATLPQLGEFEELESQEMAKRLVELHKGKVRFHTNHIANTMPWLYQIGVINYKRQMAQRGGNRVVLWRKAEPEMIVKLLAQRPDVIDGTLIPNNLYTEEPAPEKEKPSKKKSKKKKTKKKAKKKTPVASAPSEKKEEADEPKKAKKKKRKKCCNDPRIVKSKKTGKRRCKNCGTKFKAKKKKGEE